MQTTTQPNSSSKYDLQQSRRLIRDYYDQERDQNIPWFGQGTIMEYLAYQLYRQVKAARPSSEHNVLYGDTRDLESWVHECYEDSSCPCRQIAIREAFVQVTVPGRRRDLFFVFTPEGVAFYKELEMTGWQYYKENRNYGDLKVLRLLPYCDP